MLVVTQTPVGEDDEKSERGSELSLQRRMWAFVACADFFVDERKQAGKDQSQNESDKKNGLDDEDDVPGDPALRERPERADSVGGGVVEQNVAHTGEAGEGEEHSPARRKIGIARFAAAQAPDEVDEGDDSGGDERDSEEGMGKAAVMIQAEGGASEAAEDVEVGGFGGEGERGSGERSLAVESGAAHGGAEKKVSDGFHGLIEFSARQRQRPLPRSARRKAGC